MTESAILADPNTSEWLRLALQSTMSYDPVDAANEAALLLCLLQRRILAGGEEVAMPAAEPGKNRTP